MNERFNLPPTKMKHFKGENPLGMMHLQPKTFSGDFTRHIYIQIIIKNVLKLCECDVWRDRGP